MKKTLFAFAAALLLSAMLVMLPQKSYAQSGILAIQDSASLETQMDYIHSNTRVYNNFRTIREDVFLKMKKNVVDTLIAEKLRVAQLNSRLSERDFQIESLNTGLNRATSERDEAIKNKNSISILGIQMNKVLYNTVMWFIVLGLAVLAVIMSVLFKRSHEITRQTKSDLETTQNEFNDYRKSAREKYEKLVVSHHHEVMKLKNS